LSTDGLPWIEIDFPEDYERAVTEIYPRIASQSIHNQRNSLPQASKDAKERSQ